MEQLLIPGAVIIVMIAVVISIIPNRSKSSYNQPAYRYSRKQHFISPSEKAFYKLLTETAGDRYYIFPQVHLSSIFKNETVGRYRKLGFQIINRRSVDFVLCAKDTLEPVYAVELDDYTHDKPDRIERDKQVDALFAQNGIPLLRFRDYNNLTTEDIAQRFYEARQEAI